MLLRVKLPGNCAQIIVDLHRGHATNMYVFVRVVKLVVSYRSGCVIEASGGDFVTHGSAQLL